MVYIALLCFIQHADQSLLPGHDYGVSNCVVDLVEQYFVLEVNIKRMVLLWEFPGIEDRLNDKSIFLVCGSP